MQRSSLGSRFTLLVLGLVIVGATRAPSALSAPPLTLPPGFIDETVVAGLFEPRAFVMAPDGRIFIAEVGSADSTDINLASVRVFKNGALLATRALTLNVCGNGERGLLGIALDPGFSLNGYLYLFYTRQATSGSPCSGSPGPRNRVSRFTMVGDVIDPATERVLIDTILAIDTGIHNAGDLHFGADGYLYVSTGDSGATPIPAELTNNLNGKVLRLLALPGDAGGYVTSGNPFDNAADAWLCGTNPPGSGVGPCREVFAYGFRNPFRFTIQPGTSLPFVGDVGGGAWEEIDFVIPGGDYGWPTREGPCPSGVICQLPQPPSGYVDPIYSYAHVDPLNNPVDSAVIGGTFYTGTITGTTYPAQYVDNYFFADYVRGFIRRLVYDSTSGAWNAPGPDFATGGSGIIGLRTGLDGNLYYLTFSASPGPTSEIHRIRYAPGTNQAPVAQAGVDPLNGPLSTMYTFSAAGSYDPDGNLPLRYDWNLGDGTLTTTAGITLTHVYTTPGAKIATLTVTDAGTPPLASAPVTVTVFPGNSPPTGTIAVTNTTEVSRTASYYAGDTWQFAVASASDDQPLPAAPFSWSVVFHHRDHTHPFLPFVSGPAGQFTIPASGETDPLVWYRISLRITDADGQTTTINHPLYPMTTTLTLTTDPAGGRVILEGGEHGAPYSATRVVGMNLGIDVPSPQLFGSIPHTFAAWSNGGGKSQTIVVPPTGATYTAVLLPPFRAWLPWIGR